MGPARRILTTDCAVELDRAREPGQQLGLGGDDDSPAAAEFTARPRRIGWARLLAIDFTVCRECDGRMPYRSSGVCHRDGDASVVAAAGEQPGADARVAVGGGDGGDVVLAAVEGEAIAVGDVAGVSQGEHLVELAAQRAGALADRQPQRAGHGTRRDARGIHRPQGGPQVRLREAEVEHAVAAVAEAGEIAAPRVDVVARADLRTPP